MKTRRTLALPYRPRCANFVPHPRLRYAPEGGCAVGETLPGLPVGKVQSDESQASKVVKPAGPSGDVMPDLEQVAAAVASVPLAASVLQVASGEALSKDEKEEAVEAAPPAALAGDKPTMPAAAPNPPVRKGLFSNFMLEETTMDMSANFSGFQEAITEAQAKAKAAFDKSTSVLGEVSDFAKGNVEAAVESGKIFAEGVQDLGTEFVSESRAAFEVMTGDIKELAAVKSPTDFFKLQSDLVRKNFDTAVAYSSKNSEAMLKLFSDAFAPFPAA
ncbi:phasin family protein [Novosphingobium panipatense]|uniref:phasin family protein n=1 Tax=Novosphingobium panipatense TaxID=428991 RepID=UPI0036080E4C